MVEIMAFRLGEKDRVLSLNKPCVISRMLSINKLIVGDNFK